MIFPKRSYLITPYVYYTALCVCFCFIYAALRPAILAFEPNPFPALGNSLFYSLKESTESLYFYLSFAAFGVIALCFFRRGWIVFGSDTFHSRREQQRLHISRLYRAALYCLFLVPLALIVVPTSPMVYYPDYFHHGEKLVHLDKQLSEMYTAYYPLKGIVPVKLPILAGMSNSISTIISCYEMFQVLGSIALFYLFVFMFRLIRGYYPGLHLVFFLVLYATGALYYTTGVPRTLSFILFLNAFILYLIYNNAWLLMLGAFFVSFQYLISIEFGFFGTSALAVYVIIAFFKNTKVCLWSAIAIAAGFAPVTAALAYYGQIDAFIEFCIYAAKIPHIHGIPFLYNFNSSFPPVLSAGLLTCVIAVWFFLLFLTGILIYAVCIIRKLDNDYIWLYIVALLAVLSFKIGLGRSDGHFLWPIMFCLIPAYTLYLMRSFRLVAAAMAAVAIVFFSAHWNIKITPLRFASVPSYAAYADSPRIQAYMPQQEHAKLHWMNEMLTTIDSDSIFFFSDEPLYNYLLKSEYKLRNAVLLAIFTEDMLIQETKNFLDWKPDIVVWKTPSWANAPDGIRNPVRYYYMAGAILTHYRPFVQKDGFFFLVEKDRYDIWAKKQLLLQKDFVPLEDADLQEVFDLQDMPFNIGRAYVRNISYDMRTLVLSENESCTYAVDEKIILRFNGKKGRHTYAFYPDLSPLYHSAIEKTVSIACDECVLSEMAPSSIQ